LKNSVEVLETSLRIKEDQIHKGQTNESILVQRIRELEEKLHTAETTRRKLHNNVLELKGNIRVFCRVRPLLPSDNSGNKCDHIQFQTKLEDGSVEGESLSFLQSGESATGQPTLKSIPFSFDRVFGPESTQDAVFDEISQLAQSSLDGYRVCIFAYGQTGSGKTFTMEGTPNQPGMIPLAVLQIFAYSSKLSLERGWKFSFEASYLEIYNETLRDLIDDSNKPLDIKHAANGKTTVSGLTYVPVETPEQVQELLNKAAKNRAVAETQCNERSSRSHSVFALNISGSNPITGENIEGILNLVDLAGSERLSQSGSTGDRLKETQAINKSLSALGDVISALSSRESHVPFRNSKLTFLLQNSLGGNCKTLMFVNINPALESFGESLCSLRFATKVNNCHIGTARKNILKS
jgi:kinesin family member C1